MHRRDYFRIAQTSQGFSLVEALMALTILVTCLAAMMTINATYVHMERFCEERRLAVQAAVEKIEEIRQRLASGQSLDNIASAAYYAPWPANVPTNSDKMPMAAFKVPGLTTNSSDVLRKDYVGTVSLIVDETPDESSYGINYSYSPPGTATPGAYPPVKGSCLGVDINGNGYYRDAYPGTPPSPFPLDLNADNNTTNDHFSYPGNPPARLSILPVVVTVHWFGVFGHQRIDFFTIVFADKKT
jgi:Tfp pilus assembly protein PilV